MFAIDTRIYIEDTDAGGVVFYANYLRFYERVRTEWLREVGFQQSQLLKTGVRFVVIDVAIKYQDTLSLDDFVQVCIESIELRGASFTMWQSIKRNGITINTAIIKMACMNDDGRPTRIPSSVHSAIEQYLTHS